MTPAQYLRAVAKLETEYRSSLQKLKDVWAMINDGPPLEPIEGHDSAQLQIRGMWRKVARQVIDGMPAADHRQIKRSDPFVVRQRGR